MIVFETIEYRNFLSVGNNPIKIDLNTGQSTLIVGANGEGKSILLDALSFALFGKPHRGINKPQLINSINEKNCEVTVNFSIGSDSFCVIRGMKPTKFEIWQNGKLLNQDSKSKDYQKILETTILKLNHKSFHQIVVLGSSNFIPFMQLSAHHRREVIEDLLDIRIFSKMNALLKERKVQVRDNLKSLTDDSASLKEKIAMTKKHIYELETLHESNTEKVEEEIKQLEKDVKELHNENKQLSEQLSNIDQPNNEKVLSKKKRLYGYEGNISSKIEKLKKEKSFFVENNTCPTCSQDITKETKDTILKQVQDSMKELSDGHSLLQTEIAKAEEEHAQITKEIERIREITSKVNHNKQLISLKHKDAVNKAKELGQNEGSNNTDSYYKDLNKLQERLQQTDKDRISYEKESNYCAMAEELLKDSGIKTKIIQQYIPIMNRLINEYLSVFDFFVSFTIDESFEEKIRSRHRDDFSYSSFSEGEKAKIDLSLLLTWRKIAEMKNSTNTNLLIMDEVFDGSLDEAGSESLMNLFRTFSNDTSIFVISHKTDVWQDKFDRVFRFAKENNFSVCHKT